MSNLLTVDAQPVELCCTLRLTLKVSTVVYTWEGLNAGDVVPSPKSHDKMAFGAD